MHAHLTQDTDDQAALRTLLRGALPGELAEQADSFTSAELQHLINDGFTCAVTLQLLEPEDVEGHFAKARGRALLKAFARGGQCRRL